MIEDVFGPGDPPSQEELGRDAWARFLARMLDTQLCLFVAAFVITGGAGLLARTGSPQLLNILVYRPGLASAIGVPSAFLISGLLEALCLSAFGATPGKALMAVRVRTADGRKLSFPLAFKRWFFVLLTGRGLDLPVVSFILNYVAYRRFLREGSTGWDEDLNLHVERRPVIDWRWGGAIVLIVAVFLCSPKALHYLYVVLRLLLNASQKMPAI